ncbi:5-oxoproline transporter, DUF979 family subunit [Coralloluteibacterium stylophorae]|uniref:DUF979 domain-containing protein n=1 Tax=Coralloluteibacterium stylophorae TaxID=1776034 RepID=A0A8J7VXA5_9GAMM|nr:DUF979 family protein [Coralloluteibacterium stylophorae]MBS7458735.1 DUF979 domain-containing protein [Coralloluteibacterium stylophorae]
MISLQLVYWATGLYLLVVAVLGARDRGNPRRWTTAAFWALLALALLVGERLPPAVMGGVVVLLALIAGGGGLARGRYPERSAEARAADAGRLGNRLFWPALAIPLLTLLFGVLLADATIAGVRVFGAEQTTLVGLALACGVATLGACLLTRQTPLVAVAESRRLLDAIGWAALLPLLLATLGGVFETAGVGDAIASLAAAAVPGDSRLAAMLVYALGMTLLTIVMGNAFAAFPVMMGGIGLPLVAGVHGADIAPLAAIGMLCGYCGTLLTPMAANFNLVPAALLELPPYAVIRRQVATALPLLACNLVLMYFIVFRSA